MRHSTVARKSQDAQPKTIKLSWKALLSFPYRMCNPPPAVGNVRSCQVTPVISVKLADVLDRKHLPPLGLKDFEEWLLFVEQSPENLYFILWLQEYSARYDQWVANTKHFSELHHSSSSKQYRVARSSEWPKTNPSLAIFYARAKQTFFTPNSSYELNLPSEILGPFHSPMPESSSESDYDFGPVPTFGAFSPHPDPAVFNEVAFEVRTMLEESLDRFVKATLNNVGTRRALCGLIGGAVIALLGSVAPITVNFMTGRSRWLRLLALPGLWLGLTICLASLHGVCMMIYIFGDLRQLRSFELSRPAISSPQPLRNDMSWYRTPQPRKKYTTPVQAFPNGSVPITRPPVNIPKAVYTTSPVAPLVIPSSQPTSPVAESPIAPLSPSKTPFRDRYICASPLTVETPRLTFPSSSTVGTSGSGDLHHDDSGSSSNISHAIHISEAYIDEQPVYAGEPVSSPVPSSWNCPSPDPIRSHNGWAATAPPVANDCTCSNTGRVARACQSPPPQSEGWTTTASFIHPYEPRWDEDMLDYDGGDEESRIGVRSYAMRQTDSSGNSRMGSASISKRASSLALSSERQHVDRFDFDALPPLRVRVDDRRFGGRPRYRKCEASPPPPMIEDSQASAMGRRMSFGPRYLLRKIQGRCLAVRDVIQTVLSGRGQGSHRFTEYRDEEKPANEKETHSVVRVSHENTRHTMTIRLRKAFNVPAFRSPLTKIHSPIVTRAQWEVVIRSTILALFICCGLLAGILAAPIIH